MEFATLVMLNGAVMVVVDRIRAVVPQVKGAWTNLVALVIGVLSSIWLELGTLLEDLVPAIVSDTEMLANVLVGVLLGGGSAVLDQLLPGRQSGSSS